MVNTLGKFYLVKRAASKLEEFREWFRSFKNPPDTPVCQSCIAIGYKEDPECPHCKADWNEEIEQRIVPPPY